MKKITIAEIREDLSNIKYYYSRKKALDEAFRNIGYNSVIKTVELYNELIKDANPKLCDLYVSLYINNHTQESLSEAMCYTREGITMMNKRLMTYFQKKINEKRGGEENESL